MDINLGKLYKRTSIKENDPWHFLDTPKTREVYGDGKGKIKKKKTVTVKTPWKSKTKVVDYSPANRVGKQTKTKRVIKTKIK